tara:strand:+ start:108 stop:380 length:273 start_codon:yes stop_codon:yes gene_type:complete
MKGVKYNLQFRISKNDFNNYNNLNMQQLCKIIKEQLLDQYDVNMKVNNQIIYNTIARPKQSNRLLRAIVKIERVKKITDQTPLITDQTPF